MLVPMNLPTLAAELDKAKTSYTFKWSDDNKTPLLKIKDKRVMGALELYFANEEQYAGMSVSEFISRFGTDAANND